MTSRKKEMTESDLHYSYKSEKQEHRRTELHDSESCRSISFWIILKRFMYLFLNIKSRAAISRKNLHIVIIYFLEFYIYVSCFSVITLFH